MTTGPALRGGCAPSLVSDRSWRQTVIALLPELGRLSRRAIAALVGLAPYDDDSGKHRGERHIKGEPQGAVCATRCTWPPVVAKRHNPVIAAFAKRLAGKQEGHLVACMRKLLVMLNAMVRDETDWRARAA